MKKLLVSLGLAFLMVGCSTAPKDPPPSSIKAIDQSVITAVKMNMKTDMVLAGCKIDVGAENGLIVLRGFVPTEEAKAKAEELALKGAKVEKVANHLEVSP